MRRAHAVHGMQGGNAGLVINALSHGFHDDFGLGRSRCDGVDANALSGVIQRSGSRQSDQVNKKAAVSPLTSIELLGASLI